MTENGAREAMARFGRSLFARGYSCGTSGNLSVRLGAGGGYLMSPTNISLGELNPAELSKLDSNGAHVAGPPPTKETWLHLAMYKSRPHDGAVVHLHSTYATALSCLADRPEGDVLPAITPYVVMRVGRVARVPYSRPGDQAVSATISALAVSHRALLLANHGPVVSGPSLDAAVASAEELEETAKLFFVLADRPHRLLDATQIDELRRVFGS
jgi:ribulose-5-phosphate 4-epimerase/fuculose-1-phosphate aldolase